MERIFILKRACLYLVLAIGLISCGQDKIKWERLRISEPVLLRETPHERLSLSKVSEGQNSPFSSLDSLEFGPEFGSNSQLVLTAKVVCGTSAHLTSQWRNMQKLKLAQILPSAALNLPGHYRCRFHFTTQSSSGARHIFDLPELAVTVAPWGHGVEILQDGIPQRTEAAEAIPVLSHDQWARVAFRFEQPIEKAEMACEHFESEQRLSALGRFDLSDLDLSSAKADGQPLPPAKLRSRPQPRCRVMGLQGGQRVAVSPIFRLGLPAYLPTLQVTWAKEVTIAHKIHHVTLGTLQLSNANPEPIRLRFQRKAQAHSEAASGTVGHPYANKLEKLNLILKGKAPQADQGEEWVLTLLPKEKAEVQIILPRQFSCQSTQGGHTGGPAGVHVHLLEDTFLDIVQDEDSDASQAKRVLHSVQRLAVLPQKELWLPLPIISSGGGVLSSSYSIPICSLN